MFLIVVTPTPSSSCRRVDGISLTGNGNVLYPPPTKTPNSRLLSSFKTPGKVDCPWTISVPQGQKINLTAYILHSERQPNPAFSCSTILVILENGKRTDVPMCVDGNTRELPLHVSETNDVKVFVSTKSGAGQSEDASFIINYKGNMGILIGQYDNIFLKI